LNNRLVGL